MNVSSLYRIATQTLKAFGPLERPGGAWRQPRKHP